jgi:hypothetical protein
MNKIEYDETSDFHNLFILIPYLKVIILSNVASDRQHPLIF